MTWSDWALDLLFPPKCPYCQELLEGSYVPACTRCQPVLPWLVGTQGERKVDFTAGCLSPLAYRDKVVDSIHRFKFPARPATPGPMPSWWPSVSGTIGTSRWTLSPGRR